MGVKIKKIILLLLVAFLISPVIVYSFNKTDTRLDYVPGELIIKLNPENQPLSKASIQSIERLNQKNNVDSMKKLFVKEKKSFDKKLKEELIDTSIHNIYKLSLPQDSDIKKIAEEYKKLSNIEYAEPNYIYYISTLPNDVDYAQQWAHQNMESELAWDIETGNSGITIAVIDTGVEWNHPDLAANIWNNSDEIINGIDDDNNGFIDDIRGWDFVNNDANPIDDEGHGTHVSGIAAAVSNNSIGVAGMCWNCRIMPVKSLDSSGQGSSEDAADAIIYAANNSANILSMSFVGYTYSNLIKDALDYAYSKGVVLIAAAGNENADNLSYPAGYDNVISVSAINNTNSKAYFSNYGGWVDIAAPGVDILSTYHGLYIRETGTSMAAPYVSGVAALLLSKDPTLSQEEIREIIKNSAKPINSPSYMGYGRINAYNAFFIDLNLNADISSLHNSDPVTGIINIIGTASGPGFINYSMEIGEGLYPESWTTIINSLTQKNDETLAVFDTESIQDGTYTIKLTVNSNNGYITDKKTVFVVNDNYNCYSCGDCNYKLNLPGDGTVELKKDIQSCNHCLNIDEAGKTLSCNSKKILGCGISRLSYDYVEYWNHGIDINANNTALDKCVVSGFNYGISLHENSHHNQILETNITFNWIAIKMEDSYYNLLDGCSVSDNEASGVIGELGHETIINSKILRNDGIGIYLNDGSLLGHNNISNNLFYRNANKLGAVDISLYSSYNEIFNNTIIWGHLAAINIHGTAHYNNIHHNTFIDSWNGIQGCSTNNTIVYNKFISPRDSGFSIDLFSSNFSNNNVSSGLTTGGVVGDSQNSHFKYNTINDNKGDGLIISGIVENTTIISHNTLTGNKIGLRFYSSPFNGIIEYNNISNNTDYNLKNNQYNITVENNWWGLINHKDIADTIYDYYDDNSTGIVDFDPWIGKPIFVSGIECNNGSSWVSCSSIEYNNTITEVRANFTITGGAIENVTFKLKNVPDNHIFFNTVITHKEGSWWLFDNTDINIEDSGTWQIEVECSDNNSNTDYKKEEWIVPWGVMQPYLVNPTSDTNAIKNIFFNFTSGVLCLGGECGDVTVTLDPIPAEEWNKTFGGSNHDYGRSVKETKDGGFIVTGYTRSFGLGNYDVYLIKTDSTGKLGWYKTFGGSDSDYGYSVEETADGGYAIAGVTNSFGSGNYDFYLIKTDSNGDIIWNKTFGGTNDDRGYSLQQTNDQGFIITGYTYSLGSINNDVYLIKTDSAGNLEWNKTYKASSYDFAESVRETNDGGYIIAGYTQSFGAGGYDVYLIKTDSTGNLEWNKTFGGNKYDWGRSAEQATDGGYIIAGYTASYGKGNNDVYLIKTGPTGNLEWNKTFGGTNQDEGYSVHQTHEGGYIIGGITSSSGAGATDFYLIKTDSAGNLQWNKTFGGTQMDIAYSIQETAHQGYIVTGYTSSYGEGGNDVYLIRLGSDRTKGIIPINNGTPFYTISENPTVCYKMQAGNMCENNWIINTTGKAGNSYEFYVNYDPLNYSTFIDSNRTKGIYITINSRMEDNLTAKISLKEGWNLVSIPLGLENNSFDILNIESIYAYNGSWYLPDNLKNKVGYWVKANEDVNITLSGQEIIGKEIELDPGWNLIGYPYLEEKNISDVFNNTNLTMVYTYNGTWSSYVPNRALNPLQTLKPGYGYWIKVE